MNLHELDLTSNPSASRRPRLTSVSKPRRARHLALGREASFHASAASLCQHTLLDYSGCEPKRLCRAREVKALLCAAVIRGGGKIVKAVFHNFSPYGVSGVVVITESHVTIHTWPEHGYAAVDIFSCSSKLDHKGIGEQLKNSFLAHRASRKTFARGRRG